MILSSRLPRTLSYYSIGIFILVSVASSGLIAQTPKVPAPTQIAPLEAPFPIEDVQRPSFPDQQFDVRDYGAVTYDPDHPIKNTAAFSKAIRAASDAGGGKVLIPEGRWLTGPIHLKSNINLHVSEGATVLFSTDREDYLPVVIQRHEGVEAYNYSPLIYAYETENVAITGTGTLDAQAEPWWTWFEEYGSPPRAVAAKQPLATRTFGKGAGMEGMRPNFIVFWKSSNILVEGIHLLDSPMWNVHLVYSSKAIIRDISINSLNSPNGDGVVIDSSHDVLVEYNHFQTGDDAVVLKSGLNEDGLAINIPTEKVIIRNFVANNVRTGSGGVVFGSETSGGIRNVLVHDAYFDGSDRGIRFKTERGRGNVIENIWIRDVEMKNITFEAINFNTFYTGPTATGPSPGLRNIDIRNVQIDGVPTAIVLTGLPERWLEDITLDNITVENTERGARLTRVKNLSLNNVRISSREAALIADNVYEFSLKQVTLRNTMNVLPLTLMGTYTGAVFTSDFPLDQIQFKDGLTKDIIAKRAAAQSW
ncbi:MAG: glycoside hydrolase family 28 protein [Bacteroidota bacterium]